MTVVPWNCALGDSEPAPFAVAATVDLSTVDTNNIVITGVGSISSFGDVTQLITKRIKFVPPSGGSTTITLVNSSVLNLLGKHDRTIAETGWGLYICDGTRWIEFYFTLEGTTAFADLEQRVRALEEKLKFGSSGTGK